VTKASWHVARGIFQSKRVLIHSFTIGVVFILATSLWLFMAGHVAFNDDQWIHFQPISCKLFPGGELHHASFREPCGEKDLFLFGFRLPLRAYTYIGVGWAVFFLPFWLIFQSPIALHICTGTLWILNSIVMSRLLNAPWALVTCVVMMSVPVFSQHLVDTGPFSWQFLMVQLAVLGVLRAIASPSVWHTIVISCMAGVAGFLAFEEKGFVIHAGPAASILFLSGYIRRSCADNPNQRRTSLKIIGVITLTVAVAFAVTFEYVNLKTISGSRYRDDLLRLADSYSSQTFERWLQHSRELYSTFVLFPSSFFHRVYGFPLPESPMFLREIIMLSLGVASLLLWERKWRQLGLFALAVALGVMNFFWISHSRESWAGHHVVYAHVVVFIGLAIALAELLPKFIWLVYPITGYLLFVQLPSYTAIAQQKPMTHSDPTRQELFNLADDPKFASEHVVVHLSWGTFFQDALFGPKSQIVIWTNNANDPAVRALANKTGRKLAFIRMRGDILSEGISQERGWKTVAVSSSGLWELREE
jgi:hypothetical protein